MLALPFKQVDRPVDWASALDKYVRKAYSKRVADGHTKEFAAVGETRRLALASQPSTSNAEAMLGALGKYYRLLVALDRRFDLSQLRLTFVWRDAFKPSVKQGEAEPLFERAAVLFNVAAVLSYEAITQKRSETEGIKQACKYFQLVAGLLEQLRELVADAPWAGEANASGDLCVYTLDTMKTLMLAQAQRCFYEKAALDELSPKLLSLVASQAATYYKQASQMLRSDRMAAKVDASWANVVDWNLALFEGLAQFHAAEQHAAAYEYGHQVARLSIGVVKLKHAVALSSKATPELRKVYEEALAKVEWAHGLAVKDNTTVYLEPVPDAATLPAVPGTSIAKPLPYEDLEPTNGESGPPDTSTSEDPFIHIVPVAIQHILDRYDTAARAKLDSLNARLQKVVERGSSRLLELDLPHALQAMEGGDKSQTSGVEALPTSLAASLTAVHKAGGEQALRAAVTKLSEVELKCTKAAEEVGATLDGEEAAEREMETEHGPQWRLVSTASAAITAARADLSSCSAKLSAAAKANALVFERFSKLAASDAMPLLELPLEDIGAKVPRADVSKPIDPEQQAACVALRSALNALSAHEAGRTAIELRLLLASLSAHHMLPVDVYSTNNAPMLSSPCISTPPPNWREKTGGAMQRTGWIRKSHAGMPYEKQSVRRFCTSDGFQVAYTKHQHRQPTGRFDLRNVERLCAVSFGALQGVDIKVRDRGTKNLTIVFSEGDGDAWLKLWCSAVDPAALCENLTAMRDPELAAAIDAAYGHQAALRAKGTGYASSDSLYSPRDRPPGGSSSSILGDDGKVAPTPLGPLRLPGSGSLLEVAPKVLSPPAEVPMNETEAVDEEDIFVVTVPDGCRPGDKLRVTDTYGTKLIIEVPEGAKPGTQLEYVKPQPPARSSLPIAEKELAPPVRAAPEPQNQMFQTEGEAKVIDSEPSPGVMSARGRPNDAPQGNTQAIPPTKSSFMRCVPPRYFNQCMPGAEARRHEEFEAALYEGNLDLAAELARGEVEAARLQAAREHDAEFVKAIRAYDWGQAKTLAKTKKELDDLQDSILRVKFLQYYITHGEKAKALELAITQAEIDQVNTALS